MLCTTIVRDNNIIIGPMGMCIRLILSHVCQRLHQTSTHVSYNAKRWTHSVLPLKCGIFWHYGALFENYGYKHATRQHSLVMTLNICRNRGQHTEIVLRQYHHWRWLHSMYGAARSTWADCMHKGVSFDVMRWNKQHVSVCQLWS